MKIKSLSSVLIVMFAWVAVGALDCGCVYASTVEISAHNASKPSEGMDCHSPDEAHAKKSEEACCAGCQLESKAPSPPALKLINPAQSRFSTLSNASKSGALGFHPFVVAVQHKTQIATLPLKHAQSVPVYDTPVYLAVQSLLI